MALVLKSRYVFDIFFFFIPHYSHGPTFYLFVPFFVLLFLGECADHPGAAVQPTEC